MGTGEYGDMGTVIHVVRGESGDRETGGRGDIGNSGDMGNDEDSGIWRRGRVKTCG